MAKLHNAIYEATHVFFEKRSIKPYVFPITTGSVSSPMGLGSDSLPVRIALRKHEVFLADSMQFSLEVGARLNPESNGAYYIMPTFRGESVDARHLNEFVHSEAEIPGTLESVMNLAESYIKHLVEYVADNYEDSIVQTAGGLKHVEHLVGDAKRFLRISYSDAVDELRDVDGAFEEVGTGYPSITSSGEKVLLKNHGDFTWLTNMPWGNVPFYQARQGDTPYSMTADLLAGIGEILGCGQRVKSVKDLRESLNVHNVDIKGYEWYEKMRSIRPLQTAGFGLGTERLILWLTQTNDIRNCSLLFRDHDQIFYP
jgi:aspartyl/asparaginyl-tRNA synthetase